MALPRSVSGEFIPDAVHIKKNLNENPELFEFSNIVP